MRAPAGILKNKEASKKFRQSIDFSFVGLYQQAKPCSHCSHGSESGGLVLGQRNTASILNFRRLLRVIFLKCAQMYYKSYQNIFICCYEIFCSYANSSQFKFLFQFMFKGRIFSVKITCNSMKVIWTEKF